MSLSLPSKCFLLWMVFRMSVELCFWAFGVSELPKHSCLCPYQHSVLVYMDDLSCVGRTLFFGPSVFQSCDWLSVVCQSNSVFRTFRFSELRLAVCPVSVELCFSDLPFFRVATGCLSCVSRTLFLGPSVFQSCDWLSVMCRSNSVFGTFRFSELRLAVCRVSVELCFSDLPFFRVQSCECRLSCVGRTLFFGPSVFQSSELRMPSVLCQSNSVFRTFPFSEFRPSSCFP
jgi:hypothetical protein